MKPANVWRCFQRIESVSFTGSDRKIHVENAPHPYGLALTDTAIFWSDWKLKSVVRADRSSSANWARLPGKLDGLMTLQTVDLSATRDDVTTGRSECAMNNGGCSHLCLLQPRGRTCACPSGILLEDGDETTCQNS